MGREHCKLRSGGQENATSDAHRFLVLQEVYVVSAGIAKMLVNIDHLVFASAGCCQPGQTAGCRYCELSSIHGDWVMTEYWIREYEESLVTFYRKAKG